MKYSIKVLDYLKQRSRDVEGMNIVRIPRRKIAKVLKIPQSTIYYIIKDLIDKNRIKKYSNGRFVSYFRIL